MIKLVIFCSEQILFFCPNQILLKEDCAKQCRAQNNFAPKKKYSKNHFGKTKFWDPKILFPDIEHKMVNKLSWS